MNERRIVIQAVPFCFGPAANGLAIAEKLTEIGNAEGIGLDLRAIGDETAYELFSASDYFSTVHRWNSRSESFTADAERELLQADKIITVGDFEFVDRAHALGVELNFVDALFWMWDEFPKQMQKCATYFVLDFPGIDKRIEEYQRHASGVMPHRIEQIYHGVPSAQRRTISNKSLLVNFGGMQSPHGQNLELAIAMVEEILSSVQATTRFDKVLVRGGSVAMKDVRACIETTLDIDIAFSPQIEFLNELASCSALLTVPGMSIVYEALATHTPTVFLLPLNYSQHRQMFSYRKHLCGFDYVVFDDFPSYCSLPAGLPEDEGVSKALSLGSRFRHDSKARSTFREKITSYLKPEGRAPLSVRNETQNESFTNVSGASQVATAILREVIGQRR